MGWSFVYFRTDYETAGVNNSQNINSIINKFNIEETVGDEFFIRSGEIALNSRSLLPFNNTPSQWNWLALYYNDILYNVYLVGHLEEDYRYTDFDVTSNLYSLRLKPIQQVFYEHLKKTIIIRNATSGFWSYNLGAAKVVIDAIREDNQSAPTFILNRWGFSLGDMLATLVSTGIMTNQFGYYISDFQLPDDLPLKDADNLPILFRGQSLDEGASASFAILETFENPGTVWLDIFKIALFAFNSFLKIVPKIIDNKLSIEFHMVPRVDITGTGSEKKWIKRKKIRYKYKIDGVRISGTNFEYTQGNWDGNNAYDKSAPIADPDTTIAFGDERLYWAAGDFLSGTGEYDILENDFNVGYFSTGLVQPYYDNILTDGDGYEGSIIFAGEGVLDKIEIGSDIIQLNRITIDDEGIASIEGIKINY